MLSLFNLSLFLSFLTLSLPLSSSLPPLSLSLTSSSPPPPPPSITFSLATLPHPLPAKSASQLDIPLPIPHITLPPKMQRQTFNWTVLTNEDAQRAARGDKSDHIFFSKGENPHQHKTQMVHLHGHVITSYLPRLLSCQGVHPEDRQRLV